jgi:hypothetical protein
MCLYRKIRFENSSQEPLGKFVLKNSSQEPLGQKSLNLNKAFFFNTNQDY